MKVAIMNCMNTSKGCVAAGCFEAYNTGTKGFAAYDASDPAQLAGFFPCGGCSMEIGTDEGFKKKLDRLEKEGVKRVHIGNCARGCSRVDSFAQAYKDRGFDVVLGTH